MQGLTTLDVRLRLIYVAHWFTGKQNEGDISHWGYIKKHGKLSTNHRQMPNDRQVGSNTKRGHRSQVINPFGFPHHWTAFLARSWPCPSFRPRFVSGVARRALSSHLESSS